MLHKQAGKGSTLPNNITSADRPPRARFNLYIIRLVTGAALNERSFLTRTRQRLTSLRHRRDTCGHRSPAAPPRRPRIRSGPLPSRKPLSIDIFTATLSGHAHRHTPPLSDWATLTNTSTGSRAADACLQTDAERKQARRNKRTPSNLLPVSVSMA